MKKPILMLLALTSSCLSSNIPPPHPAVVAVRREEEALPLHLRKPALYNDRLWEVLPITSLLHHGEMPVYHREADKVERREIYSILTHAGFVPRSQGNQHGHQQRYNHQQQNNHLQYGYQEQNNHLQYGHQEQFRQQQPAHVYFERGHFEVQDRDHSSPEHLQYL